MSFIIPYPLMLKIVSNNTSGRYDFDDLDRAQTKKMDTGVKSLVEARY